MHRYVLIYVNPLSILRRTLKPHHSAIGDVIFPVLVLSIVDHANHLQSPQLRRTQDLFIMVIFGFKSIAIN